MSQHLHIYKLILQKDMEDSLELSDLTLDFHDTAIVGLEKDQLEVHI